MTALPIASFQARRAALAARLPSSSMALIPAAELAVRSRDTEYPFRQNSDFWYLTGFAEPQAFLVLVKPAEGPVKSHLFCLPRDPAQETWTGYRLGPERAVATLAVDQAAPLHELDSAMLGWLNQVEQVFLTLNDTALTQRLLAWRQQALQRGRRNAQVVAQLHDLQPELAALRQIKSEEEIQLMRRAAAISATGHLAAMQACAPGGYEYQLQAELEYSFKMQGAAGPAYGSIVGSGANACILHYVENNAPLQAGDLVLIDAGAEYQGYAGDITRTFPVSGQFSEPQLALYRLVLKANALAISLVRPGADLEAIHQRVIHCLTEGLIELGLLAGPLEQAIEQETYKAFYMHGTSHWLGLDVHDVGAYRQQGQPVPLQPGMVLTIEPGLYIAPDAAEVPPQWRGIGIRIEDDVLVTPTGCEVLTEAVPKDPEAIEALMMTRSKAKEGRHQAC
ncbi:Xaa-Pro aminopeptidase [Marinospirillum sp.]|uniref:Xaa-Pro aminopeptidase n=1 Tax=Marinospirillum sp. TaxID=2183934 RepID=UPI003A849E48